MGAIPERAIGSKRKESDKKSLVLVGGIIAAIAAVGLLYLAIYVAPEEVMERVEIIAVTPSGCIGQTFDGYAVNIGQCEAQPGDTVMASVDQKVKERAYAMNPTD